MFKVPDVINHWIQKWAVADELEKYDPQNVDKAKELLADGRLGFEHRPDVRHYPPTLDPDIPVIQEMWKDVGVKIKLTPLPDDTFVADFYEDKDKSTPEDDGPELRHRVRLRLRHARRVALGLRRDPRVHPGLPERVQLDALQERGVGHGVRGGPQGDDAGGPGDRTSSAAARSSTTSCRTCRSTSGSTTRS